MWKVIALFIVIVTAAHGQSTSIVPCIANAGSLPLHASIHGCGSSPCLLPQLEEFVIDILFKAPKSMIGMRTLATAYMSIFGISVPIPYDLQEDSVTCNFLTNTGCPVNEGEIVQYTLKMYIDIIFPVGTEVALEFHVQDENDLTPVFCLRTDVRIVPPRS